MLRTRVIPCLLLRRGGLVKTIKFNQSTYIGDPINAVKIFNDKEVDELIFLDIDASKKGSSPDFSLIGDLASECFMPFAYGGGVSSLEHIEKILTLGVEKIVINTALLKSPDFVREACRVYGSSTIIASIDVNRNFFGKTRVYDHTKKKNLEFGPIEYAKRIESYGIGEIFVNVVYKDGTFSGYDEILLNEISNAVSVPVIACGGASSISDFGSLIKNSSVSGVAAGSLFVYQGPHRAVLISYPPMDELTRVLS